MRMRVQPGEVSMGAVGCDAARFSGGWRCQEASADELPPKIERGGVIIARGRSGREIKMDMIIYFKT